MKPAFGGFGSLTNTQQTGFGTQNQQTSFGLQNQQQGKPQIQEKVWQELALIRAHFDPTSPLCHFRVSCHKRSVYTKFNNTFFFHLALFL